MFRLLKQRTVLDFGLSHTHRSELFPSGNIRKIIYCAARRHLSTQYDIAGLLASPSATLMSTLHDVGLNWWVVLPLTAFSMRTLVILPFLQIPYRKALARQALLKPLLDAKTSLIRRQQRHAIAQLRNSSRAQQVVVNIRYMRAIASARNKISKQYNAVPRPLWTRLGAFCVLLVASEAIRRMSGQDRGLLSLLFWPFAATDATAIDEATSKSIEKPTETAHDAQVKANDSKTLHSWYQPSLKTGGLSWWCHDLTKPDAKLYLPFIFSGTFAASVYFAPRAPRTRDGPNAKNNNNASTQSTTGQSAQSLRPPLTNIQRLALCVAALAVYPALLMPSGLLIYLISNMAVNAVHTRYLARRFPIRLAPSACRNVITTYPVHRRADR